MENVSFKRNGDTLTITVDLAHRGKKTDKTQRVASTEGNVACPENPEIKIGLNVYAPLPR